MRLSHAQERKPPQHSRDCGESVVTSVVVSEVQSFYIKEHAAAAVKERETARPRRSFARSVLSLCHWSEPAGLEMTFLISEMTLTFMTSPFQSKTGAMSDHFFGHATKSSESSIINHGSSPHNFKPPSS